nr:hypothetical protein [Tanacetum cinerariifolium]
MYHDVEKSVTVAVIADGNNLVLLRADQMATLDDMGEKLLGIQLELFNIKRALTLQARSIFQYANLLSSCRLASEV